MTNSIMVTGANGQLGREFQYLSANYPNISWHFLDRQKLDISDSNGIKEVFKTIKPTYCINCAAYTNVDGAETNAELAHAVNVTGIKNLAITCRETATKLIHFSTDYVYNTDLRIPIDETAECNPQGVYAKSKWNGDRAVIQHATDWMILRVSWLYSRYGSNFVKTMIRLGTNKDQLSVVCDQMGSPTNARDLACAVVEIIDQPYATKKWNQIYHFANSGLTSWDIFAERIMEIAELECQILPITTEAYGAAAKRPAWSVLSTEKFKNQFCHDIPEWQKSLRRCIGELKLMT